MSKSLYSLILNDEVVRRIDAVADVTGTNRSNLINRILAEYVSYTTPEQRITNIFGRLSALLSEGDLSVPDTYSGKNFSVTTSLTYRYKPTVKYSIQLYETLSEEVGELRVSYRINAEELLYRMSDFFSIFIRIESEVSNLPIRYAVSNGRFTRTFVLPAGSVYSAEEIGKGISDFIKYFDTTLKKFLNGEYVNAEQIKNEYRIYRSRSIPV